MRNNTIQINNATKYYTNQITRLSYYDDGYVLLLDIIIILYRGVL